MGADRLKHIKDNAKRNWNKAGKRLTSPAQFSLFDVDPKFAPRTFRIALNGSAMACVGEELLLQSGESGPFLSRGPSVIGECIQVPASTLDELGFGGVICVEVVSVGKITNTIEVAQK